MAWLALFFVECLGRLSLSAFKASIHLKGGFFACQVFDIALLHLAFSLSCLYTEKESEGSIYTDTQPYDKHSPFFHPVQS